MDKVRNSLATPEALADEEEKVRVAYQASLDATGKLDNAERKLALTRQKIDDRVAIAERKVSDAKLKSVDASNKVQQAETKLQAEHQKLNTSTDNLGSSFLTAGKKLLGFTSIAAAALGALKLLKDGAVKAFETIVNYNSGKQKAELGFTEQFGGNKDAAKLYVQQLEDLSARSGDLFDFPKLKESAQQMMNLGFSANEAKASLEAAGNAAAANGWGNTEVNKLIESLQRMKGEGRVTMDSMNSLVKDGLPAWDMLAEKMGTTPKIAREAVSKGLVGAESGIDAVVSGINKKWPDAMEKMTKIWDSMWSRIGKNTKAVVGTLGAPFFDWMNGITSKFDDMVAGFTSRLQKDGLASAMRGLVPNSEAWQSFVGMWESWSSQAGPVLEKVGKVLGKVWGIVTDLSGAMWELGAPLYDALAAAFEFFGTLSNIGWGVINDLLGLWEPLKEVAINAWHDIQTSIEETLDDILSSVSDWSDDFVSWFSDTGDWASGVLTDAFADVIPVMTQLWEDLKAAVWPKVQEWVKGILDFLAPITNFVGLKFDQYTKPSESKKPKTNPQDDIDKNKGRASDSSGARSKNDGDKAEKAIAKIEKKIRDLIFKMDDKIFDELAPAYENSFRKLNDEVDKWMTDLKEQMKTNKVTVDLSELEAKAKQYKEVLTEPIKRAWRNAWTDIKNDTAMAMATIVGDHKKMSEIEYDIAAEALERQKRDRFKAIAQNQEDAEAKLAVEKWYQAELSLLQQRKADQDRQNKLDEFDRLMAINETRYEIEGQTVNQINRLNKELLENKLKYLDEELRQEGLTNEQILAIRQERVFTQKALESVSGGKVSFVSGLKEQTKEWTDWSKQVKDIGVATASALQTGFDDFFFDAMTGELKSLSDYFSNFLKSMAKAVSQAFSQMLTSKLISKLFGGISLPGRAVGGPQVAGQPYIVGENGPELHVPQSHGRIINTNALKSMSGATGTGDIQVNIINQSGEQMQASKSETKFDGARTVITLWMEAIQRNIGGSQDMIKSLGGA